MSQRHPIIAITGSSGAGTTTVTRTFDHVFRREGLRAAIVEGDSFHKYDRQGMKVAMAEAAARWGDLPTPPAVEPMHSDPESRASSEAGALPEICRFYGIVIKTHFADHAPSHFHAVYGDHEALLSIETLEMFRGDLPRRAAALVLEWAALHRDELRAGWTLAQAGKPLLPIPPLE